MTDIPNALTPEEWAHPSNAQQIGWACNEVFVGEGDSLDTVNRHGLAALCLYSQPYGFTREDVAFLRRAVVMEKWEAVVDAEETQKLECLAARIAALLPPEDR